MSPLRQQIGGEEHHGERQHLVVMDNNILGIGSLENVIGEIRDLGFHAELSEGRGTNRRLQPGIGRPIDQPET